VSADNGVDRPINQIVVGQVTNFREGQVQPRVGWPLFEMALQNGNAPVILRESRAWCRALEFSEEFGNSLREKPAAIA
jgi:hypothetical protein